MTLTKNLHKPEVLIEITSGASVIRLAERTHSYGGNDYLGLVKGLSSVSNSFDILSLSAYSGSVNVLLDNTKPCFGGNRISDLALTLPFLDAVVYWNYEGGNATEIFTGVVDSLTGISFEECTLSIIERSAALEMILQHSVILESKYPQVDPNYIGRMEPIIYGNCSRVPVIPIDAGSRTSLLADMTSTSPGATETFVVSDGSRFPTGVFAVQIDGEHINISSRSGNVFTVGGRGYNSTTATGHDAGSTLIEVQSAYLYLIADHPITSVSNVYVDDVRVTANYTIYNGSGSQHPSYPGRAILEFTSYPVFTKTINVTANDTITFSDGADRGDTFSLDEDPHTHGVEELESYDAVCLSGCDYCQISDTITPAWGWPSYSYAGGVPTHLRIIMSYQVPIEWSSFYIDYSYQGTPIVPGTYNYRFSSVLGTVGDHYETTNWLPLNPGMTIYDVVGGHVMFYPSFGSYPDGYVLIRHVIMQVRIQTIPATTDIIPAIGTSPDGSISKVGTVTVTSDTSAETVVPFEIDVDVRGYDYDLPNEQRSHLLQNRFGLSSGQIDSVSYNAAGAIYSGYGFEMGILIDVPVTFQELTRLFSEQATSIFYWEGGQEKVKFVGE